MKPCARLSEGRGKATPPISVIWRTWLRPHRRVSLWIKSSRMRDTVEKWVFQRGNTVWSHRGKPQREEKTRCVWRATRSSAFLTYAVWMGWVYHETKEVEALGTLTVMGIFNDLYLYRYLYIFYKFLLLFFTFICSLYLYSKAFLLMFRFHKS